MTSRLIYEAILIELNKNNAPSLRLHEFNYLFNKAINDFVGECYLIYDTNLLVTDSLRVLLSECFLTPKQVVLSYPKAGDIPEYKNNNNATYEVFLPEDYLHLLNCTCIYYLKLLNKCYDAGDYLEVPATKLTADSWSTIMTDIYNRPSPWKPYYYLHNRNSRENVPTNPTIYKDNVIDTVKTDIGLNQIPVTGTYINKTDVSAQDVPLYYKDGDWYTDKECQFAASATYRNFNPSEVTGIKYKTEIKPPFSRTINLSDYEEDVVEKPAYTRVSNPSKVRMEIRYGKNMNIFIVA